jgi:hypothetical protein
MHIFPQMLTSLLVPWRFFIRLKYNILTKLKFFYLKGRVFDFETRRHDSTPSLHHNCHAEWIPHLQIFPFLGVHFQVHVRRTWHALFLANLLVLNHIS